MYPWNQADYPKDVEEDSVRSSGVSTGISGDLHLLCMAADVTYR